MAFNYGFAYRVFLKELAEKHKLYAQLGLRQDQVDAIDEYDWAEFRSNCVFYHHNSPLDFRDDVDMDAEEELLTLLTAEDPTANIDSSRSAAPFAWMDEITSTSLLKKLLSLPISDLSILDEYVFGEKTQREIAAARNITQQAVQQRIRKMRQLLGK